MKSAIKIVAAAVVLAVPAISFAQSTPQRPKAPPPPAQAQAHGTPAKHGRLFKVGPHYPDDIAAAEARDTLGQ